MCKPLLPQHTLELTIEHYAFHLVCHIQSEDIENIPYGIMFTLWGIEVRAQICSQTSASPQLW